MARRFRDLSEQEILALAIFLEEEDGRIYADVADGFRETYPATAQMFREMQAMDTPFLSAAFQVFFNPDLPLRARNPRTNGRDAGIRDAHRRRSGQRRRHHPRQRRWPYCRVPSDDQTSAGDQPRT